MAFGGLGRTPRMATRTRRNFDRLRTPASLFSATSAIQPDAQGRIVFLVVAGEPFSQSSSGFVLELEGDSLKKTNSSLRVNESYLDSRVEDTMMQARLFTDSEAEKAKAIAFFLGEM
jgi:hypothetical protein